MTTWQDWWPDLTAKPSGHVRLATSSGTTAYGRQALAAEAERVAASGQGVRNDSLNRAAFRMGTLIGARELDRADAVQALTDAGAACGLPEREVQVILREGGALDRGVDVPRAVEELQPLPPLPTLTDLDDADQLAGADQGDQEAPEAPARSTWSPRDLAPFLAGELTAPTPSVLTRTDGQSLFYAGRVNGLIGESESGKSWLLLLAIRQVLLDGGRALLLDFEDDPAGIVGRLRALRVPDDVIGRQFVYVDPDTTLDAVARDDLAQTLREHRPDLIGLDGVNAAMTLLGLDVNSNTDATRFAQLLLRPLARTGATVGYVDHLPKAREGRAPGAIGAQAKRAMTDGCAILVEVTEPFGKGQTGRLALAVDKDRPGAVRGVSQGARHAGVAVLVSNADGSVDVAIEPPGADVVVQADPNRPQLRWQKVSQFVADVCAVGEPPTGHAVEAGVIGKAQLIRDALVELVERGHLVRLPRKGGGFVYRIGPAGPYSETPVAPALTPLDEPPVAGSSRFVPVRPDDGTTLQPNGRVVTESSSLLPSATESPGGGTNLGDDLGGVEDAAGQQQLNLNGGTNPGTTTEGSTENADDNSSGGDQ